jgi:osmotically-inducible protein OsmY
MHKNYRSVLGAIVLCGGCLLSGNLRAAQSEHQRPPDNTAVDKQDRDRSAPTADQAKNNLSDRDLMQHIRKDVVHDKSLSTYGHNVKIIAQHGNVTLKGPVHSEDEKRAVEEHARRYTGEGHVDNQLTVKEERHQ